MSKSVDEPYSLIALPSLALNEWEATKETLHRYAQIVGKVRLSILPSEITGGTCRSTSILAVSARATCSVPCFRSRFLSTS